MKDFIAIFEFFLDHGELLISTLLGLIGGVWLSLKVIAPRLYDPKIRALESHIRMQDATAKRQDAAQAREIERLSNEVKALRERLAPIEEAMSRQFADALNPERT